MPTGWKDCDECGKSIPGVNRIKCPYCGFDFRERMKATKENKAYNKQVAEMEKFMIAELRKDPRIQPKKAVKLAASRGIVITESMFLNFRGLRNEEE